MASTHKHIRSSTANKRPTTALADGQIALNTNSASPGLFFKDSTGATIIKIGPVHVGATAPNASPAAGGSAGNSSGEVWLDISLTPLGVKIWNGSAWVNATPIGSTTVQGLLELATDAETQAGSDNARAVTPASLQSKVSDSTSTTSSTTIASSTAVKAAYDLANAALPKTGGTVTGNLEIGTTGSLSFEGSTADGFETTIAVVDPTADRTITLPNTTGTVVTTGDTGTVTSTMLADGTIVDADISATAEIAVSKLADGAARQLLQTDAAGTGVEWTSNIDIPGTLDVTGAAAFDSSVAVTGALTKSGSNVVTVGDTGTVTSTMIANDTIVNADINSAAAIAGTKISPDFGSQTITTSGLFSHALGTTGAPTITFTGDTNTGIYSPGADQVAISTNGTGRLFVDSVGTVSISSAQPTDGSIRISNTTTRASGNKYGIRFADNSFETNASIYAEQGSSGNNASALVFATSSGSGGVGLTSASERLRITSAGLVGVGTSSPSSLLHIGGGAAGITQATLQGGSVAGDYGIFAIQNGSTVRGRLVGDASVDALRIDTGGSASTKIQFYTGSSYTNAVTIDSSQRVGIGTTSPANVLDVVTATSNDTVPVRFTRGGGGSSGYLYSDGSGAGIYNGGLENAGIYMISNNRIDFRVNGSERARIDSSGRLLVGTSSESGGALLQVNGDRVRIATAKTPASASATGATGEVCWDANYIYVCTGTNTWKRAALSTW